MQNIQKWNSFVSYNDPDFFHTFYILDNILNMYAVYWTAKRRVKYRMRNMPIKLQLKIKKHMKRSFTVKVKNIYICVFGLSSDKIGMVGR